MLAQIQVEDNVAEEQLSSDGSERGESPSSNIETNYNVMTSSNGSSNATTVQLPNTSGSCVNNDEDMNAVERAASALYTAMRGGSLTPPGGNESQRQAGIRSQSIDAPAAVRPSVLPLGGTVGSRRVRIVDNRNAHGNSRVNNTGATSLSITNQPDARLCETEHSEI